MPPSDDDPRAAVMRTALHEFEVPLVRYAQSTLIIVPDKVVIMQLPAGFVLPASVASWQAAPAGAWS